MPRNNGGPPGNVRANFILAMWFVMMFIIVIVGLVSYNSGMTAQKKIDHSTGVCK